MKRIQARVPIVLTVLFLLAAASPSAFAGGHTWRVHEIFTNASGTVQFIEVWESAGTNGETGTAGHSVTSTTNSKLITANVAAPTAFKTLLFGTAAYDALPNSPTPDYIIPAGFFNPAGDTIGYSGLDTWVVPGGSIPTDGINSLTVTNHSTHAFVSGPNSPKNLAGVVGGVDASPPPPPGVPDRGATPVKAAKLDAAGSSLSVSWDTVTCADSNPHQIVFGSGSQLPTAPGGTFGLAGSTCAVGSTSPYLWTSVPDAGDATGLLWWLIIGRDGSNREGSWGEGSDGLERNGPGAAGSSAQCGVTTKNVSNACGH